MVTSQAGLVTLVFSDPVFPLIMAPTLLQPFVVGPGLYAIPAKLVSRITLGKFVEMSKLLSSNLTSPEWELQLLLDGGLVLTSAPKKVKR